MEDADYLVAVRDEKFKRWLQNKSIRDKGLEVTKKL